MFVDAPGNDDFTKLLLHFDAPNGSITLKDFSASNHTVTAFGNAQITTAQSKFGGSSIVFDGGADYFLLDGSADFLFGTGDFTIEFWTRLNATGITQTIYDSRPPIFDGTNGPDIYVNTSNKLVWFINDPGTDAIISATSISSSSFTHAAIAKASGSTRMFIDGVQEGGTYADSQDYVNPPSRPVIGTDTSLTIFPFNGWIDELRVSKGIARYTANFTPAPCSFG